jgi:hypothetical protein
MYFCRTQSGPAIADPSGFVHGNAHGLEEAWNPPCSHSLNMRMTPLAETLLKLQSEYAHGCIMDSSESLRAMPLNRMTFDQFAAEVLGQSVPA